MDRMVNGKIQDLVHQVDREWYAVKNILREICAGNKDMEEIHIRMQKIERGCSEMNYFINQLKGEILKIMEIYETHNLPIVYGPQRVAKRLKDFE